MTKKKENKATLLRYENSKLNLIVSLTLEFVHERACMHLSRISY